MTYPIVTRKARLFVLLIWIATVDAWAFCLNDAGLHDFVRDTYGDRIEFDVIRNGKQVGEHRTVFSHTPAGLRVRSGMQLTVKVLFIPVFDFDYESVATWCGGDLVALKATVDRNGTLSAVQAAYVDTNTIIETNESRATYPSSLLPTNHWNPRVLNEQRVLNTITGQVNDVEIVRCAAQRADELGLAVPSDAKCYEYTGDLLATVWYQGERWIGLAFKGEDGSDIVYQCRRCGAD